MRNLLKRNPFKHMKIASKLMVSYLLACVIPLLVTSMIIYKVSAQNLEESSLEFASVFSSQIVAGMDEFIEEYDRVTKSVLVDNDIIEHLSDEKDATIVEKMNQQLYLRKIMMRIMTLKPEIKTISLMVNDGQLYQFGSEGDTINYEVLMQQPWLKDLQEWKETLGLTAVHDCSYYDRNQDGIVFTVGRKILNRDGAYMGMLLIDLDPAGLVTLSDGFLLARNQYNIKISITNSEHGVLYDSDVASGRINWSEAMAQDILLYQKNANDYIVLNSKTKKAGLNVHAVIPRSDLLFKISRIEYVTVISEIVCVAAVIVISILFSRTITSPIRRLQSRMRQMEAGEYRIMEEERSQDEIGSLITSYNHMVLKIKNLIEEVYLGEIEQRNAKFLALQTQINPHMLYNTLESIRMKALRCGADEVAEMVKLLARMFRVALSEQSDSHKIRDEIEYAEAYMRLQNLRFRDMFSLEIKVPDEVQEAGVISMVLQPVIENSIEHGFRGRGEPLHMILTGRKTGEGMILLDILDDGKGIGQEEAEKINLCLKEATITRLSLKNGQEEEKRSIGLKNIAERLRLQYGSFSYIKLFVRESGGTGVEICIPDREREEGIS